MPKNYGTIQILMYFITYFSKMQYFFQIYMVFCINLKFLNKFKRKCLRIFNGNL